MKLSPVSYAGIFAIATVQLGVPTNARLSNLPRRLRAVDQHQGSSFDDGVNNNDGFAPPTSSYLSMPTKDTEAASPDAVQREVCIVGGGPSGTYAAYLLEQKGYNVVLFDEATQLGGKTLPYADEGFRHVITDDMKLVNKFINEYNLEGHKDTRKNLNAMDVEPPYTISPQMRENWFENLLLGAPGMSPNAISAALRYGDIWDRYESVLMAPNHDAIPEELMMPADEWLEANDVVHVQEHPLFYNGLSNYGYSYLNSIPAVYLLKYVTPTKIQSQGHDWFPMHLIFKSMGLALDGDVHSNTRVEQMEQLADGTWDVHAKQKVSSDEENLVYNCDSAILAFPPTTESLGIVEDLDADTTELFTNVATVDYWEAIISDLPYCAYRDYRNCLAPDNMYFKSPPVSDRFAPTHNIPNVYFQPRQGGETWVLFNAAGGDFTQEDVFDIIRGHLHAAFDYEPDTYRIELYQKWPYFPHVNPTSMKSGFYNDLEEVQGKQNLYFTGGFRDFELVDNSMRTTEDLLDRHFASKN